MLNLQRKDIDVERGSVRVERALLKRNKGALAYGPKRNSENRTVHVPSDVLAVLTCHLDTFVDPRDDAPLFTGKTGQPLRPSSFGNAWDRARKSIGITRYRFHDLRHFAATEFSATGASLQEVAA